MSTSYISPKSYPELGDRLGLTVEEIALSLNAEFKAIKRRCEQLERQGHIRCASFSTQRKIAHQSGETYDREIDSYVLAVEDAYFVASQFRTDIGKGYCRFLISRETQFSQIEAALKNPLVARKFADTLNALADAQEKTTSIKAIADYQSKALTSSQRNTAAATLAAKRLAAENVDLKAALGDAVNYKTVKAMLAHLPSDIKPIGVGKALAKISKQLDLEIRKIECSQFGTVNAYPVAAWHRYLDQQAGGPKAGEGHSVSVVVNINGTPHLPKKRAG